MLVTDCPQSECSLKTLETIQIRVLSEGNFTEKDRPSGHHFLGLLFLETLPHPTMGGKKLTTEIYIL